MTRYYARLGNTKQRSTVSVTIPRCRMIPNHVIVSPGKAKRSRHCVLPVKQPQAEPLVSKSAQVRFPRTGPERQRKSTVERFRGMLPARKSTAYTMSVKRMCLVCGRRLCEKKTEIKISSPFPRESTPPGPAASTGIQRHMQRLTSCAQQAYCAGGIRSVTAVSPNTACKDAGPLAMGMILGLCWDNQHLPCNPYSWVREYEQRRDGCLDAEVDWSGRPLTQQALNG